LAAGLCIIGLQTREAGVKIDKLLLTTERDFRPQ
jgi:hypothetical protein